MKIDQSVGVSGLPPSPDPRSRQNTASQKSASLPADVKLSALSASLQKAEAAIAQSPVVSGSRVNEIKQAIAEGQFEINPERIANGLISSVREMLSGAPSVHS